MAGLTETLGIIFNKRPASVGSIVLDASIREVHSSSATITDHPVEDGANIADHVNRRPDVIAIEGVVSNTTLIFPSGIVGIAPIQSLERVMGSKGEQRKVINDLAQTAYTQFLELMKGTSLVKIVTTLRTYENMLLEDFTVTRDARHSNAIFFTVRAREVRLVSTKLEALPEAGALAGQTKKSLGKKTTSPASSGVQTQSATSLSKITGAGVAF